MSQALNFLTEVTTSYFDLVDPRKFFLLIFQKRVDSSLHFQAALAKILSYGSFLRINIGVTDAMCSMIAIVGLVFTNDMFPGRNALQDAHCSDRAHLRHDWRNLILVVH